MNEKPIFISYEVFIKELEYTISLMTGYMRLNMVEEIINLIDYLDSEEDKITNDKIIFKNEEEESINFSFDSEDNKEELSSFDKNEFYDEISYNCSVNFEDNEINFDDEDFFKSK